MGRVRDLLAEAIQREISRPAFSAVLRLTFTPESWTVYPDLTALGKAKNMDVLFEWTGFTHWSLSQLGGDGGTGYQARCDGETLTVGQQRWNSRVLFEFPDLEDDAEDAIAEGETLRSALWPYSLVAQDHLFPLSRAGTFDQLRDNHFLQDAEEYHVERLNETETVAVIDFAVPGSCGAYSPRRLRSLFALFLGPWLCGEGVVSPKRLIEATVPRWEKWCLMIDRTHLLPRFYGSKEQGNTGYNEWHGLQCVSPNLCLPQTCTWNKISASRHVVELQRSELTEVRIGQ